MMDEDGDEIKVLSDKEYNKKVIDEGEMECIRCTNELHFCLCPDDMTFEEKFNDVIRRCYAVDTNVKDIYEWRNTYLKFFARYFKPIE